MIKSFIKQNGIFYTNAHNPFLNEAFLNWAERVGLSEKSILEPFAGANHVIRLLEQIDMCSNYQSFDISPGSDDVIEADTITNFPIGFEACVTNPPWLYKSRARRLGLNYPETKWDNLYKHCLELCLKCCDYVAILIPASFLSSDIFLDRLDSVAIIQKKVFFDTDNPVCLAMFSKDKSTKARVFLDDEYIGNLSEIRQKMPKESNIEANFNHEHGDLGLIAIDNTREPSIRFCMGCLLEGYDIRPSSRSITRISVKNVTMHHSLVERINQRLEAFRNETHDIFMTPFKGIRKDGKYRRRLDYRLAKRIIAEAV